MRCVLITTRGERIKGAEELHRLGYHLEIYPSTRDEETLLDTRVEEFIPFIHRHPETTEGRSHVRSLRASFIRMLEDSRYDNEDLIIFGESDAFPQVDAKSVEEALRKEVVNHPETDIFRLFHDTVWIPTGAPPEDTPLEFDDFITGETDANSPYVWGTHALVIPCSKRKKISKIFRTYRLPTDIALEAANSNGEISIRTARYNLFYQHPRSESDKNKKIAVCLSSYKRLTDLQRQIWCMMDQSYSDIHVFAAIKGMPESTYKRLIEPLFSHFVREGRLTMRLFPNKNQLSNFVDTIRDIDISDYDLFAKVDDDDVYGRDYFKIINDVHQMLPDDFSSYYCGKGEFIHQKNGISILHDGEYSSFGPTLVCSRSALQKIIDCERNPNRIGEISSWAKHSGYGYTEDNLMHILMEETGAINREPYVRHELRDLHISIQCSNSSVTRGGFIDDHFFSQNHYIAHGSEHEECFLELKHNEWNDIIRIVGNKAKRTDNGDQATIISRSDSSIILEWERWGIEKFIKKEDAAFHHNPYQPEDQNGDWVTAMKERKKVAVLFMATGNNITFWDSFYQAARQYFLTNHDVHYFLFTDHEKITGEDEKKVTIVHKKFYPWPMETLRRFESFLLIEEELKGYDYIYFLTSTLLPVSPIGEEIFPSSKQGLMVVLHPRYYKQPRSCYPYDQNHMSEACIPITQGEIYVAGGFNGGTSCSFLQLCRELQSAIKRDLQNGIIAAWHDESHLNKYIIEINPLILNPEYFIPEKIIFNQEHLTPLAKQGKMIVRNKFIPLSPNNSQFH